MALNTLAMTAYNLSTGASQEISALVEELRFTTLAPGGYGDLTAKLKITSARLQAQQSQFALFARVAIMDGPFPVYLGRWEEPAIVLDQSEGDEVQLTALGASQCLTDDPVDQSYGVPGGGLVTGMYVINDQMTSATLKRNKTLPLDPDQSNVLPDQPSTQVAYQPNGRTFEEILNDLLPQIGTGDYTWTVWGHQSYQPGQSTHADAAGFPSWQLNVHTRDTSTVKYTAYLVDEASHDIRPSVEYSYSVVTVKYRDVTTLQPALVTVTDSRLNADGSQGTCPIPWRRHSLDASLQTYSPSQAAAIGNALLAEYKNGGAKVTVVLDRVRDANGSPIPLWQVRADSVIALPELAPLAAQLPTSGRAYTWANGGTLFYIAETEYAESSGQTPTLTVTCNEFHDNTALQLRRLEQIARTTHQQEKKLHSPVQAAGEPLKGSFSWTVNPTSSSEVFLMTVVFNPTLSATPTSMVLTVTQQTNVSGLTAGDLAVTGCSISWTVPSSASASTVKGTWQTVGN